MSQVVLITGCSTGIGRDLAQRLTQAGYSVVATARKTDALADVPAALQLALDVTRQESVDQAVEQSLQRLGRIDVLVNNAGYALRGAVEEVPLDQVQQMFDVNVYGVMRMIRAVAPVMRQQGAGRIINIGSIGGKLVVPVNGAYSATKYALEALSDAMRLELAGFGIRVVLIEPGNIRSSFAATALAHAQTVLDDVDSPYHALYQRYLRVMTGLREHEAEPEVVSRVVQQAIESARPRARYVVAAPLSNRVVIHAGDALRGFVLKRLFNIHE